MNSPRGVSPARAMTTATATRRLAAILAADVVGYSRYGCGRGKHARARKGSSTRIGRSEDPRASRPDRQDHRRRRAGRICQRRRRGTLRQAKFGARWPTALWISPIDDVIPLVEKAIRLSPGDPDIGWRYLLIGTVASAAIAYRRSDRLARKRAQRDACRTVSPQPPRLRPCPERRNRARCRRTR